MKSTFEAERGAFAAALADLDQRRREFEAAEAAITATADYAAQKQHVESLEERREAALDELDIILELLETRQDGSAAAVQRLERRSAKYQTGYEELQSLSAGHTWVGRRLLRFIHLLQRSVSDLKKDAEGAERSIHHIDELLGQARRRRNEFLAATKEQATAWQIDKRDLHCAIREWAAGSASHLLAALDLLPSSQQKLVVEFAARHLETDLSKLAPQHEAIATYIELHAKQQGEPILRDPSWQIYFCHDMAHLEGKGVTQIPAQQSEALEILASILQKVCPSAEAYRVLQTVWSLTIKSPAQFRALKKLKTGSISDVQITRVGRHHRVFFEANLSRRTIHFTVKNRKDAYQRLK